MFVVSAEVVNTELSHNIIFSTLYFSFCCKQCRFLITKDVKYVNV
jgi:hypothetical protein